MTACQLLASEALKLQRSACQVYGSLYGYHSPTTLIRCNASDFMPLDTQQHRVLAAACLQRLKRQQGAFKLRQVSCPPEPSEAIAKWFLYHMLQPHEGGANDELRAGYS